MLWDVDHTLLNAGGLAPSIYREVFRDLFGHDPAGLAPMAGRTERAIILDTLAMAGVPDPPRHVDSFVAALTERAPSLRARFAARGHALPGAADALAALAGHPDGPAGAAGRAASSSRGHPRQMVQSVLTGNVRAVAEAKLAAVGLARYLDLSVGAYGEYHEVRAELVHLARRQAKAGYGADFGGTATVLVGDTPLDVAAALAAGARVVGIATGGSSVAELAAAGASAVLPDLTDTRAVLAAVLDGAGL